MVRDLIRVAPDWASASEIGGYGWMAFASAVAEQGSPQQLLEKESGIFRHMTQLQAQGASCRI